MGELETLTLALADRYAIDREIGVGGMATVFLARDLKHDRQVALKVLKPELGAVLGVDRFLAEIKVTANLQHPNLLPLFDSGEARGLLFYVMPFVEGESLRARLDREKQLPVDEAVRLAVAIAGALDYAHQHGVIHRDLKPENILLQAGQPVIADFGIALAVSKAGGQRVTQTGLSLGTPQYMSPEQATGDRAVDGRTDIYSLGAMTYEMLTGEPPHVGTTAQSIIAKLMTEDVRPLTVLRRNVPAHVDAAVRHALEKLAADRFETAGELGLALQGKGDVSTLGRYSPLASPTDAAPARRRQRVREVTAWALVMAASAGFAWALARVPGVPEVPVVRMTLELPLGDRAMVAGFLIAGGFPIVISPQGDRIVYVTQGSSGIRTIVRRTSELVGRQVAANSLSGLTFSPDGRWLAYVEGDEIKKVQVDGGTPVVLGRAPRQTDGMSWTSNTIVIGTWDGLHTIPANGGGVRPLGDSTRTMLRPVVLPDGETVVHTLASSSTDISLAVTSLASGQVTDLGLPVWAPLGMLDGYLLYVAPDAALMAVPFDAKKHRVTGDAVQVETGVTGAGLSASGTLAYMPGQTASRLMMAGTGRADVPLIAEERSYDAPRFSPDGKKVAVALRGALSIDIWIYDRAANTFTKLTSEGTNTAPEWSSDGTRVLFKSIRDGAAVWWQLADGSAKAELLHRPTEVLNESILSPDGKWLVYRTGPGTAHPRNIFAVQLKGDMTPLEMVVGPAQATHPRLSPDGKWLAYQSNESGRFEIFVRPFPELGPRVQVSDQGGTEPLWASTGRSLFYRTATSVVSVAVPGGGKFSVGERRTALTGDYLYDPTHANYDIAPDGNGFLMLRQAGVEEKAIVIHNWSRELREKLAAGRK